MWTLEFCNIFVKTKIIFFHKYEMEQYRGSCSPNANDYVYTDSLCPRVVNAQWLRIFEYIIPVLI